MKYSNKEACENIENELFHLNDVYTDRFIKEFIKNIEFQLENIQTRIIYLDSIGEQIE